MTVSIPPPTRGPWSHPDLVRLQDPAFGGRRLVVAPRPGETISRLEITARPLKLRPTGSYPSVTRYSRPDPWSYRGAPFPPSASVVQRYAVSGLSVEFDA